MINESRISPQNVTGFPGNLTNVENLSEKEIADLDFVAEDTVGESVSEDPLASPLGTSAADFSSFRVDMASKIKEEPGEDAEVPEKEQAIPENAIKITILHTNDIHGMKARLPALTKVIEELREENPNAVLVDSGDIGYSAKETGEDPFEAMVEYMNQNAYFAVVPGNHDFQWGLEAAEKQFFSKLEPTVLCANMLDKKTGYPLPNTKPHIIKEIDGVKVAFIGVTTTKIATREQPVNGEDLIALNEVGILEREIALSRGEGAEVFIALVHKGFTDMSEIKMLSRKLPELDLIVIGHDHAVERASYRTGEMPHRTYIVEAGCYAQNVGKVDIYVDPETKEVIASKMKTYPTKKYLVKNNGSTGDLSEPME